MVSIVSTSVDSAVENVDKPLEKSGWILRHYSYNTHHGIWCLVQVDKGAEFIRAELRVPEPSPKEGRKNARILVEKLMEMCENIRKAEKIAEDES
jgi:hypothetical protein